MSDNGISRFWKIPDQAGIFFCLCVARGVPQPPIPLPEGWPPPGGEEDRQNFSDFDTIAS